MKNMSRALLIFILLTALLGVGAPVWGEDKPAGETLTKGEVIQLITASDFMKKKVEDLVSWTTGYDLSKVSRGRLTPSINYVQIVPRKAPPDGRTVMELFASVDDPGGLKNISGVRADLTPIGRLPNAMLVDSGLFGDRKAADGVFTLQASVAQRVPLGKKDVTVTVANKKGWLALAKVSVEVKKDPEITGLLAAPQNVTADGRSPVRILVRVDNPGRPEDIRQVLVDTRVIGLAEPLVLKRLKEEEGLEDAGWEGAFTPPAGLGSGIYSLPVEVTNQAGGKAQANLNLTVYNR
jgi:hypothetical protein